jgi:CheY-like chemotaxis protein
MADSGGVLDVGLTHAELNRGLVGRHSHLSPGRYLKLTVNDTGHGIRPELLDRIFEPYFTTKEKGEGTGLGLAVVEGIVKSHGGAILVDSTPGKGTQFQVFLPALKRASDREKEKTERDPTGVEHVLFLDDEPTLVEIGKQMLEQLGYQVTTRTSSVEALDLFRAQPGQFDLVITDMTMPQMTGDRLAQELMSIRKDLPVILCTGFSHAITGERAAKMGIKAFLMKPLVRRDLARTVREVLDRRSRSR